MTVSPATWLPRTALIAAMLLSCAADEQRPTCMSDNAGLTLPPGFCALVVADSVGRARHLTVTANGDVLVALGQTGEADGGVLVLRDTDGDGVADRRARFGGGTGDDVELRHGFLYYSTNDAVMRYEWAEGAMEPVGPPDTIVSDLPATRSHRAKSIAFDTDTSLFVNIGSPSNACQDPDRTAGVAGMDPCDELATRAGIWRFHADRPGQTQPAGERYATGLRNTVALAMRPDDGRLYGVVHGRDQLSQLWPALFTDEESAANPSEEFLRIDRGTDGGWPYCYHDPAVRAKVLAPEYGGDGSMVGRCASAQAPLIGFPAHWAPNGLHFYQGRQFPARYHGGAFIAFHGSWNRAPLPQEGYNIAFAPFQQDVPSGTWEVFADGFAGEQKGPGTAAHRPVGLAEGPDGSLYVTDDRGGRIYRILFVDPGR